MDAMGQLEHRLFFLNQKGDILIIEEMTLNPYSRNTYG